ncbi:hypothetical protein Tco_0931279 [Tanacetum coccineum]
MGVQFVKDKVVQSDGQQVTAMKEAQSSFASVLLKSQSKQTVKISEMHNMEAVEGARVTIPMAAVEEVSLRFKNTLYGFFIGKRLAFPLFETKDGMEKVMEGGPWLVRLVPLFLNVWTPNMILIKEDINTTSSSNVDIAMREFKECVDEIKVMDVPSSGLHFTWNQKPKGAHAIFQPYRTSDHAPAVLMIPTGL